MQTVAMISQKGGSGKTTLAVHFAVAARAAGLKVALVDLDPQASAASWGDRRGQEPPTVISAHAVRLKQEMQRVKQAGGDLLVLDTAPRADSAALTAAAAADLVVVPCRPSIVDIEPARTTLDLVGAVRTPVFVAMNAVPPRGGDTRQAVEAIREAGISACPHHLTQLVVFSRSLLTGQTAQEINPGGRAAREIAAFSGFALEKLKETANEER